MSGVVLIALPGNVVATEMVDGFKLLSDSHCVLSNKDRRLHE